MSSEEARLAKQIEVEELLVTDLRRKVGDATQRVKKLQKKQRTVEDNMCNFYDVAKQKVDERNVLLSAARVREATAPRDLEAETRQRLEAEKRKMLTAEKRQRTL